MVLFSMCVVGVILNQMEVIIYHTIGKALFTMYALRVTIHQLPGNENVNHQVHVGDNVLYINDLYVDGKVLFTMYVVGVILHQFPGK